MTQHELQRVRELAQDIIDLLGPRDSVAHLAPQARSVRNGVLGALSQARQTMFQPPVVDLWALSAALIAVTDQIQSMERE